METTVTKTFLNDLGITCSLGVNKDVVFKNLHTVKTPSLEFFDNGQVATYVGKITTNLPDLNRFSSEYRTRNNQLALLAYEQIEASLSALKMNVPVERIAVVIGTSTSGIASGESSMESYLSHGEHDKDYHYSMQEMSAPAEFVAHLSGAKGVVYGISTACTSSAKAIISGQRLLDSGLADIVIAGGIDSLCDMTINGFKSLESISEDLTRPFQQNRKGINIGEGSALFVMSKTQGNVELSGFGESSDAYHISAPQPEGLGSIDAITQALSRANISAPQVDYINLHGTGTVQNDAMEAKVVNQIFGNRVACSSTKSIHGHCLGASGAIELGLCWLLLGNKNTNNFCPPTLIQGDLDAELAEINLITQCYHHQQPLKYCMSNSYAFGGNNSSIIIGRNDVSD